MAVQGRSEESRAARAASHRAAHRHGLAALAFRMRADNQESAVNRHQQNTPAVQDLSNEVQNQSPERCECPRNARIDSTMPAGIALHVYIANYQVVSDNHAQSDLDEASPNSTVGDAQSPAVRFVSLHLSRLHTL